MFEYPHEIYNTKSAEEIVPFLNDLFKPENVIDIGCGSGTWLNVFLRYKNIKKVLGIDGLYVDRNTLVISNDEFLPFDLNNPIHLEERFDLVLCLEVAEHLLETSSDSLIESLVKLGDVIIFSAAIPEQTGIGHVNEQWPEYWRKKFRAHSFYPVDMLRKQFWDNEQIEWWYRQNMFIYVNESYSKMSFDRSEASLQTFIHPGLFDKKNKDAYDKEKLLLSKIQYPGIRKSFKDLINALKSKIAG